MPPSTSSRWSGRSMALISRQALRAFGQEALAAKARLDGHEQDHVNRGDNRLQGGDRGFRLDGDTHRTAEVTQLFDHVLGAGDCFQMEGDAVAAGLDEFGGVLGGVGDHQVGIEEKLMMRAEPFDQNRAEGKVGDEMAVHDIQMQESGARSSISAIWPLRREKSALKMDGAISMVPVGGSFSTAQAPGRGLVFFLVEDLDAVEFSCLRGTPGWRRRRWRRG